LQSKQEFAPFLLPFLMEKLESPAEHVKTDCYKLLQSICDKYGAIDFAAHYVELWTIIKADSLMGGDSIVQTMARSSVQHITRAMQSSKDLQSKWIALIRSELEPCLVNPELNCFLTASIVLSEMATVKALFGTVTLILVKHFEKMLEEPELTTERAIELLKAIESYSERIAHFPTDDSGLDCDLDGHPLTSSAFEAIDRLFSTLANSMAKFNGKRAELHAYLRALQSVMGLQITRLDQECLDLITHKIVAILSMYFQIDEDKASETLLLQVFATFVRKFPRHANFHVYPFILRRLAEADWHQSIGILHAVQLCSFDPSQLNVFLNFALTTLTRTEPVLQQMQLTVLEALKSLRTRYLKLESDQKAAYLQTQQLFYCRMIASVLNHLFAGQSLQGESWNPFLRAIALYAPDIPREQAANFAFKFFLDLLCLRTPTDDFFAFTDQISLSFELPQFQSINIVDGSDRQVMFVRLLHASLIGLDFEYDPVNIENLLTRIWYLLFNSYFVHDAQKQLCERLTLELLEYVVAKMVHIASFETLLGQMLEHLYQEYRYSQIISKCTTFINIYRSIGKALLHVNHSMASSVLDHLAGLFLIVKEPELMRHLVCSFEYIVSSAPHLSADTHVPSTVRFVVQRYFYSFVPRLLSNYHHLEELLSRTQHLYEQPRNQQTTRQILDETSEPDSKVNLNQVGQVVRSIEQRIKSESDQQREQLTQQLNQQLTQQQTKQQKMTQVTNAYIGTVEPTMSRPEQIQLLRVCLSHSILLPLRFLPTAIVRAELIRLRKIFDEILLNSQPNQPITFTLTQLHCIRLLFELDSKYLLHRLPSVITFLLEHLQAPKQAIRAKCVILDCLTLIANTCPEIELIKTRRDVIHALEPSLDDRRRVVRYASVKANCRWVLIGQPS
jgi:hypothetical protein